MLTFGVSGKLIRNGMVMYDDETDTLWSQVLGEAVQGSLLGNSLEIVPSTQTTWKAWRELYPDTLVLDKGGRYRSDPYERYYLDGDAGIVGRSVEDNRLYLKEYVIGLSLDGRSKAYPFSVLDDLRVVNDSIGSLAVLVVFDKENGTGLVYDRSHGGRVLEFEPANDGSGSNFVIRDTETGTRWQAFTGEAIDGQLEGETLTQIPATYVFWFGWVDHHPDTELFEG